MKRKICFVTGTRAEFGLLKLLIHEVQTSPELELQLVATGMHLSPEFGLTYQEIEKTGIAIDARVEMLLSADTATAISKSMGLGLISYADVFARLCPDIIVLLGDRFEIFAAATAALISGIPVAHIHGGEKTEGAFDESLRHSITKMSNLHFVAAEEYQRRVIQLGEMPDRIFLVGGLGVDNIKHLKLLNRKELEEDLGFKLGAKNLLVTFHPVTLDAANSAVHMQELLAALAELDNTQLIFTMPNSDTNSRGLIRLVEQFVAHHSNAHVFYSLGQLRYLSCIKHMDGVIGNSSSGLLEAPTFKKGTVNIGDRQKGRLQATSVINCEPTRASIGSALEILYSRNFQGSLQQVVNPYGEGGATKKILNVIKDFPLKNLMNKTFYDLAI